MNRQDIIAMAIEADLVPDNLWETPELERFAALVIAKDRGRLASGVELPEKRRGFFCTKCGSDVCVEGTLKDKHPPCSRCSYLGFASDLDYTADQLRDYGDRRAAAEREAAALVFDEMAAEAERDVEPSSRVEAFREQAAAIRARSTK